MGVKAEKNKWHVHKEQEVVFHLRYGLSTTVEYRPVGSVSNKKVVWLSQHGEHAVPAGREEIKILSFVSICQDIC